jgi:hypothetical protein
MDDTITIRKPQTPLAERKRRREAIDAFLEREGQRDLFGEETGNCPCCGRTVLRRYLTTVQVDGRPLVVCRKCARD